MLLVEDDANLRAALAEYLEINGFAVTAVENGMSFYRELDLGGRFQVAVIDLGLPDQPGHVLADYARRNTKMSVVVITANDSIDNRVETYRTGADLFLAKPLDSRELLAAMRAMAARYVERHGTLANLPADTPTNAWELDRARRQIKAPDGLAISLSPQEVTVCELFGAAGSGNVDRRQILENIYGRDDISAQRALDNLIRRLRQKIADATGHTAPILTAYGIGHSFSEPLRVI
ncbi:MAG: response regulator transcription factor [Planctomycetes bacterium]|nr:response regulator transcription factor [Planctomycetota bacterium]